MHSAGLITKIAIGDRWIDEQKSALHKLSNSVGDLRHVGPQDRAWVDRFDFKKGPPSRGANPRSSIHPTEKLRYLPSRVERRRRGRMEKNKRRRRIERTITMSGGREVRAASGKAPGLPT